MAKKEEFFNISFRKGETLANFAKRFYHDAQILLGAGVMNQLDCRITMTRALKPYKQIWGTMFSVLGKCDTIQMATEHLARLDAMYGPPN